MKKYKQQYLNRTAYYSIYGSEDKKEYILILTVPRAGHYDVAMVLNQKEIDLMRKSEEGFTKFTQDVMRNHRNKKYEQRRIDHKIKHINREEITLEN